jgi:hypothetical protein
MLFTARISANLTFTREEVEYLALCAQRHYDSSINDLVIPGPGAMINGMRTRLLNPEDTETTSDYTFREIDKLAKAVEFQDNEIATRLRHRFFKACGDINFLSESVNGLLETFSKINQI